MNTSGPDSVRSLRAIARRVANGDVVVPGELADVLETIGPSTDDFVVGRALRSFSRHPEPYGAADRRRVFHAARALADRLEDERPPSSRAPLAKACPR
jgi:hypothetical protein